MQQTIKKQSNQLPLPQFGYITKIRLFKYIEKLAPKKTWMLSDKNTDIFYISAQNRLWVRVRTASPRRV